MSKIGTIADKIYLFGEKGSGTRSKGHVQDFKKLRGKYLKKGTLFEDDNFPAKYSSLFYSKNKTEGYEWKRPKDICDNPKFFVEGHSRFDAIQGYLGDCWIIASVTNLTLRDDLFSFVVPIDQGFGETYAGIFHFRFWQYGRWIDVVVDDRLPVKKDTNELSFMHSTAKNEFWSALLEKAYAKIHGSYEALAYGFTLDAMQDFTGGISEYHLVTNHPPNLFEILLKASNEGALMCCAVRLKERKGLIAGHAYSITKVIEIEEKKSSEKVSLLRLRNPWGQFEWKGAWSDNSFKWKSISKSERESIGLTVEDDGEFWMSYEDFETSYIRVEICHLCPHSVIECQRHEENELKMTYFEGEWVKGVSSGGRSCYLFSFFNNPQYLITLTETDSDDDENCTLIIALMQKNRRAQKYLGIENLMIGYEIYKVDDPDNASKPLDSLFFFFNDPAVKKPATEKFREVNHACKVPPGTYCIVPHTYKPNEEGEFLLRIFSRKPLEVKEHDQEVWCNELNLDERVKDVCDIKEQKYENDETFKLFKKYASDNGGLNWLKLKNVLDNAFLELEGERKEFSKEVCRSMVAMLDVDRSGELSFQEFKILWSDIQNWKIVFYLYDIDNSGTLEGSELRKAFNSAGYSVNRRILNVLMRRYGNQHGQLVFEDFIICAVKLKTMIGMFETNDLKRTNVATFSLESWIENTLYA